MSYACSQSCYLNVHPDADDTVDSSPSEKRRKRRRTTPIQGGAPSVIRWFITPLTIVISTINHSYWSYVHQLS